jgi:type IV secretion system protein VirD4
MMPQEVRQLPEDRMLLLVEGQRPILGGKIRFHQLAEFKTAAKFSARNQPVVPDADFVSMLHVPAVDEAYGGVSEHPGAADVPADERVIEGDRFVVAKSLGLARVKKHSSDVTLGSTQGPDEATERKAATIASRLKPTAEHLRDTIDAQLHAKSASARSRMSISEILKQTVPDPSEVGFI